MWDASCGVCVCRSFGSYGRPCAGFKPGISIEFPEAQREEDGMRTILLLGGAVALGACTMGSTGTGGQGSPSATAQLRNAQGQPVGTASLTERDGRVRLVVEARGLAPGEHGIHLHAVGRCDPPGFTTAGDHFNPTSRKHGLEASDGAHAGDLPNLRADASGAARYEATTDRITLSGGTRTVFDADGSAVVIHARPDDQRTDPSGNSGDRVVCGVIERRG
jgi:Cu-Zn family superoxide dismutase